LVTKALNMSNTTEFTIHVRGAHVIEEGPGFHTVK